MLQGDGEGQSGRLLWLAQVGAEMWTPAGKLAPLSLAREGQLGSVLGLCFGI